MTKIDNTHPDFKHHVHKKALDLLSNDLYWDINNPDGPFSVNRVSNTFQEFVSWRLEYQEAEVLNFLPPVAAEGIIFDRNSINAEDIEQFLQLYPARLASMSGMFESLFENNIFPLPFSEDMKEQLLNEAFQNSGFVALKEQDDLIISAGFGQLILEGYIDASLKLLTEKALTRQLLPLLISKFPDRDYQELRRYNLKTMIQDIRKI